MKRHVIGAGALSCLLACSGGGGDDGPAMPAAEGTKAIEAAQATAPAPPEETAALDTATATTTSAVRDPGPRGAPSGAGVPFAGLSASELRSFELGKEDFSEAEAADEGLGPTMNLDSCLGCHSQPAAGGTSPAINPQVAFASKLSATNAVPSFIRLNGP